MPLAKAFQKQYQVEYYVRTFVAPGDSFTVKELQWELLSETGREYSAAVIRSALAQIHVNGRHVEKISRTEWRKS